MLILCEISITDKQPVRGQVFANCRGGFHFRKQDINAQTSSTMRVTAGWIRDEEECVGKMIQFLFSPIKSCFFNQE